VKTLLYESLSSTVLKPNTVKITVTAIVGIVAMSLIQNSKQTNIKPKIMVVIFLIAYIMFRFLIGYNNIIYKNQFNSFIFN
jgi:phosphotransferase system  glucose/maltose/N-acetylglucosamine-specific IIC component